MEFDLNELQKMLARTARDFLERECPSTLVREMEQDTQGYLPELYRKMTDLGWFGLCLPEKYGGSGGDLLDLMVLMEEMGRVLLPGPFFATVVLGGLPLLAFGNESQRKRFLPQIAAGKLNFTLALTEPDSRYALDSIRLKADRAENGYFINGVKLLVPYAHVADFIITAARTKADTPDREGVSLLIVDNKTVGITCRVLPTIAMDKQCEVIFENVAVPEENILGELGGGTSYLERCLQQATVVLCAQMIGSCRQVLEMTVDYAKQRILFGRPMGNLQIIQGYFADMLALLEDSCLLTYEAGWKLNRGVPCAREVSMAKARTSQAYRTITSLGHRIHGGVGYALEHDIGLYFRRAKAAEINFGDADFHFEKIAGELGL